MQKYNIFLFIKVGLDNTNRFMKKSILRIMSIMMLDDDSRAGGVVGFLPDVGLACSLVRCSFALTATSDQIYINSGTHSIKNPWNAYPGFGPKAL